MTSNHQRSYLLVHLFLFIFLIAASSHSRTPLSVQANATFNGTTRFVQAGDDLQAILNQAKPGDTILLEAGATFTGNFVLPEKGTASNTWITIRSSATDAELPPSDTRINPSLAHLLPKIVSPNSEAALRASPGAHHFRIIGIEFTITPEANLSYGIVKLGEGNETSLDALPHDLVLDRCYIHGQPLADITRGVALNSAAASILNSYIADCHGIGFDTQAIASWNGAGPFTIINNYLEGAGENVLFGGADPKIANLVPSNIEFRRNLVAKPLAWKEGILAKPASLTGSAVAATGLLVGGTTYYYRVAARARAGQSVTATSAASDELSITLQAGENLVQLNWSGVQLATVYRIYRTVDEPTASQRNWIYYEVETSNCPASEALCPFTDSGSEATVAGSAPPARGTRWSVKNIFELKNARGVVVDGNTFENNWVDAQSGIAILFTVRNQDGKAPWSVVEDVRFTNNIVRHTAGAINILGQDNLHPSEKVKNIKIVNNLFEDVNGKSWGGGNGVFLTITDVANITVIHNTILQSGNIVIAYGEPSSGVRFMNNILQHNDYGIIGDGTGTGKSTLNRYLPGKKFKGNAFIGGQPSLYPELNLFFPSIVDIGFTDPANGNYELIPASPLKTRGTDGTDVGCDMKALRAAFDS
jgi:hypothetical protein